MPLTSGLRAVTRSADRRTAQQQGARAVELPSAPIRPELASRLQLVLMVLCVAIDLGGRVLVDGTHMPPLPGTWWGPRWPRSSSVLGKGPASGFSPASSLSGCRNGWVSLLPLRRSGSWGP